MGEGGGGWSQTKCKDGRRKGGYTYTMMRRIFCVCVRTSGDKRLCDTD